MKKIMQAAMFLLLISGVSNTNAGLGDKWNKFREKHIDPVGDKAADTWNEKREEHIDPAGDKADKYTEKWNHWREEKLDPLGDTIELFVRSLRDGAMKGFPNRFKPHHHKDIPNPTFQFGISSNYVNALIKEYMKTHIPLDDRVTTDVATNNYIHATDTSISFDEGRNIITVRINSGIKGFDSSKVKGGFRIRRVELEIAPVVRNEMRNIYLDLNSRMVFLNLKKNPTWLDKSIAQAVQEDVLNKRPLASVNLSDAVKLHIPVMNTGYSYNSM